MGSYWDYSSLPKRAEPLYAFPTRSVLGCVIKGVLKIASAISTTLRLTSEIGKGSMRLTSEINKGSLKLTSKVDVNC